MVQPVSVSNPAPSAFYQSLAGLNADGSGWLPDNLDLFPAAAADVTTVNPSGTPQAFALSLADVMRLSRPEGPFPTFRLRVGARNTWWWLRTPSTSTSMNSWILAQDRTPVYDMTGFLAARRLNTAHNPYGGVRPAIIIGQ